MALTFLNPGFGFGEVLVRLGPHPLIVSTGGNGNYLKLGSLYTPSMPLLVGGGPTEGIMIPEYCEGALPRMRKQLGVKDLSLLLGHLSKFGCGVVNVQETTHMEARLP